MDTPCIEWTKAKDRDGYGVLTRNNKKNLRAHRVAWIDTYGEIPEGMWVLHKCDNKSCVNPEHLFIGTAKDNTQDCIKKNRRNTPRGSNHHAAKLNEDLVLKIRTIYKNKKLSELSEQIGVSISLIGLVKRNKIWKHVIAENSK